MLAQLGSTIFEIAPFNMHGVSHDAGADFAEKAVMSRRPPLEFVGEAPESWSIQGRLFPHKFGGLDGLEELHQQRRAGKALPFMRGDGVPLGWVVIEQVEEKSSYLDAEGVGKVIEFEVSLKRGEPASGGSLYSVLFGLFG